MSQENTSHAVTGTLNDENIEELASSGKLIIENFDSERLKQACYELRAGSVYYDLAQNAKRIQVEPTSFILLKPRQHVVIITLEKLDLPDDLLGRILTKGKLFSIGLLPVNTYADPGFHGNLGIVFFNASTNYLKIPVGEPIAKIEFTRLRQAVRRRYHGQHGYQTSIWPIPTDMVMTEDEISKDERILPTDQELLLSYGADVFGVVHQISRYYRALIFLSCGYFMLLLLLVALIAQDLAISVATGVGVGIVANILTGFVVFRATNMSRRSPKWKWRT